MHICLFLWLLEKQTPTYQQDPVSTVALRIRYCTYTMEFSSPS